MGLQFGAGKPGWRLRVYTEAGEASGRFYGSLDDASHPHVTGEPARDPERSRREAAARARRKLNLYAASNRLNRLATLTYAPPFCTDPMQLRSELGGFFRGLRASLGDKPFPYLWVPEYHADQERFHAHFAVGRFVHYKVIRANWPHGFVSIKLLGNPPAGTTSLGEARAAARYLSKYVSKSFDWARMGLHRYEVAQHFQPPFRIVEGRTRPEVLAKAVEILGPNIEHEWYSEGTPEWGGPPAMKAIWRG
jgi:hypothetical protein